MNQCEVCGDNPATNTIDDPITMVEWNVCDNCKALWETQGLLLGDLAEMELVFDDICDEYQEDINEES